MRLIEQVRPVAKAVVSAVVVAAAYLIGVIPAEGGFGDVSVAQWLGLVVFVGGAYGITYATPDSATPFRRLQRAERGEGGFIGTGSTGNSTGPHLHFEAKRDRNR